MATTWINYKELRGGLSFQDILTRYNVTLRAKGDQWHGFCPLPTHDGTRRSPSFSANIAKGIWHCFGCGAKGKALEFIARMEGYNPDDKAEFRKAALFAQKTFAIGKGISVVARAVGVTRPTITAGMKELGDARQRVPMACVRCARHR